MLAAAGEGHVVPDGRFAGFGGLHGGLVLALATVAMQRRVPDARLRSASARLYRGVDRPFGLSVEVRRAGRIAMLAAGLAAGGEPLADASAVFSVPRGGAHPPVAPPAPAAPPPGECEVFVVPPEFVPISAFWEVRPVGPNRPFAGGAEPELTAWVRLTEDDAPPDAHRLVLLMDALAPAYAAILPGLAQVPTLEYAVRPAEALAGASSPWVLLRARAGGADASGWNEEVIDAWGPDGAHLGTAHQLRLARSVG
ncbi:acyl-CoA thioesterase [Actinomadura parmotrematis]|uniref:Thioesterase family protein n=1 Tax=Actinomadura parmotrematis TaxID=2864039 RepID=A0ABS7FZN1_9ACTN|nr:acyl-CoA thioesterase domain-containing protein [Actinomadura parmotrematis]MBW8485909.1 thioesterase family protein [Actinomadura parmotrematis]